MAALLQAALLLLVVFSAGCRGLNPPCPKCSRAYITHWNKPFHELESMKSFYCSDYALACYKNCKGLKMKVLLLKCTHWDALAAYENHCKDIPKVREKNKKCAAYAKKKAELSICPIHIFYEVCRMHTIDYMCSPQAAHFGDSYLSYGLNVYRAAYPYCKE